METAEAIVEAVRYYFYVGGAVAVAFLAIGLDRIDPSARGAIAFRPLLIPGIMLLWPLVLAIWLKRHRQTGDAP
ncbi:MAG: hypothetical protein AAF638_02145 [Pseudomonadota bacterium]